MKRALLTAILGIAASVATTYGQGHVIFSTYVGAVYQPIRYSNPVGLGHTAGETAGAGFNAQLYYGLGAGLSFAALSPVPGSITPVGTSVAGYVTGNNTVIPNYVSGPITFAIVAFNGPSWGNAANTFETALNQVLTWTETSINSTALPTDVFQQNVPAITVSLVPEPSTFALAGLGSAAMLIFRRRK